MIVKRVDVHKQAQSQSMSKFEVSQPKEKFYKIEISRQEYLMTSKDIHEWLKDYPEDKDSFIKQMSEADRREIFGEPQQAQTPQKQSLFARVKHSLER